MKRIPLFVFWSLLVAALILCPAGAEARRPQDADQDVLVLVQRRAELKKRIEAAERELHIARETVRRDPEAAQARARMQAANQAFQKLAAEGRPHGDPAMVQARENVQQAHREYAEFADGKLAENPEMKERIRVLNDWKAELARIELLLRRNAKSGRHTIAEPQS